MVLAAELDAQSPAKNQIAGRPVGDLPSLATVVQRIHQEAPQRAALCLSGGGIRSASFCLGVLQELAHAGLLKQFDYLSTVSGGGYIGGWLSAWSSRRGGIELVEAELAAAPKEPLKPEPEQIRHLRTFSNYLAPRLAFSADTWALIATVIRNLLLNWLVLLSLFTAILVLPCFSPWIVNAQPSPAILNLILVSGFALITLALIYPPLDLPGLGNLGGSQRLFLLCFLLPLFAGILCLCGWWAGFRNTSPSLFAGWAGTVEVALVEPGTSFPKGLWPGGPRAAVIWMTAACLGGSVWGWLAYLWKTRRQSTARQRAIKIISLVLQSIMVGSLGGLALTAVAHAFHDPARLARSYILFAPVLALGGFFVLVSLFIGISSFQLGDEDREWWGRALGWLLIAGILWVVPHALMLYVAQAIAEHAASWWKSVYTLAGGASGILAAIYGFSTKTPAEKENKQRKLWGTILPILGAVAFFLTLSVGISSFVFERSQYLAAAAVAKAAKGSSINVQEVVNIRKTDVIGSLYDPTTREAFLTLLAIPIVAVLIVVGMGFFININKFSLHTMYRNRLIRAFLGASRLGPPETRPGRSPHPFTGFDPNDNIDMHELQAGKLFHVVNMALNVLKGEELAWQERKAQSFTATPLHCGNWRIGYRPSKDYGGTISLGTALAISGAAANPNAGYHSSPIVTFLLALFNLRLGWWLGNPSREAWKRKGPVHAAWPMLAETFGATQERSVYVNLSDGGHFENLGIYEMVLRRCHFVLAVDGGCDVEYQFEDLGNAIRKVRIDFGIDIEINLTRLIPLQDEKKRFANSAEGSLLYCAVGTIHYERVDPHARPGQLVYLKPMLTEHAPADVANYRAGHPEFPHETTADQFFGESQLESYRALGAHQLRQICGQEWKPAQPLGAFFTTAKAYTKATDLKIDPNCINPQKPIV